MKQIFTLVAIVALLIPGFSQNTPKSPTKVTTAVYFDVTPPLTSMPAVQVPPRESSEEKQIPNKIRMKDFKHLESNGSPFMQDPVLQTDNMPLNPPIPAAPIQNFEGINNTWGVYPPDTQGDVGPNHYMQMVNLGFAVWNKTGTLLYGPVNSSTIWQGIPSPWNGTNNGDPIVLYDQAADRWLATQFSLPNTTQYAMLLAVSQTSDPTGSWYRWVFEFGNKMPDYPKFGVWPDGYYMSVNQFISGSSWGGVGACAFERDLMLTGNPSARMVYFDLGASGDPSGMLPSDWDGATPPQTNEPNYFSYFNDWSSTTEDYLKIWAFDVDWTNTANSTFTEISSLVTAPFDSDLCAANLELCVPQPGTSVKLEALTDRLMFRLQYRNFGTHRSMVTNHTVDVDGTAHAGIRWYELRNTGSGWSIYQQGTYSPDADHRWMGSIAMNASGVIALGYSISNGTSLYPSIRYTGRLASDPLGTMTFPEETIINGGGSQTGSAARWGDYSMMSVDPVDDGTFWFTTEYLQSTGSTSWRTRIASFQLGPVQPVANFAASTTTPCLNNTVTFTDQSTGIPSSWQWTVTPATYSYMDGTSSTSQNPHIKFTAYGNYTISLTVTNGVGSDGETKTNYISVNPVNPEFSASLTSVVVGNSTVFTDASTCGATSWSWNFGADATPATANTQGPHTVTYSATGQKTVTLTVNGSYVKTKTNYINVIPPDFNMGNTTITTCNGNFYDPGGSAGQYSNNQDYTMTFNPAAGNKLQMVFNSFDLEYQSSCNYDYLKIYNGPNTSATLVGTYCGTNSPGTVTSSHASGSLTFVFHSDGYVVANGWAATINCISTTAPPVANFSASTVSPLVNATVTFTDLTTNSPTSWQWAITPATYTFVGGTNANSQNPQVQFTATGAYNISLSATNAYGSDNETKANYINVVNCSYCASTSNNASEEWISNVTFATINNSSGGSVGYQDFTSLSTIVNPGSTYTLSVSCGQSGGSYTEYYKAFIDWNQDCDFADAGETFDLGSLTGAGTKTLDITIPSGALTGPTRMRVSVKYNATPTSCESFSYGQVEDYIINVQQQSLTLNLKLYLEGLYQGMGLMRKAQNESGDQYPGTVADQITVELHGAASPYPLIGSPFTVDLNINGTCQMSVPGVHAGSHYIVVKHRNSIEVWSSAPVNIISSPITYDFSTLASKAFGNNQISVADGIFAFFTGDPNQDGIVDGNDLGDVDNDSNAFMAGYIVTDVTGDGIIDSNDLGITDNNNNGFVSKITP